MNKVVNTKDKLRMERSMVMASVPIWMVQYMKEVGTWERRQDMVFNPHLMELSMKDHGKMTLNMEKELKLCKMEQK